MPLFVKGAAFKKEFLLSAIAQGLGWYVAEQDYEVGIPVIVVSDIKKAMSLIAMEFYGNPQEKLKLLASLELRKNYSSLLRLQHLKSTTSSSYVINHEHDLGR